MGARCSNADSTATDCATSSLTHPGPIRDHTITPDIETASDAYAQRFSGAVGRFFLETQRRIVADLLTRYRNRQISILEIGGGHGQLTELLLQSGHRVVVHGSDPACFNRLRELQKTYSNLEFVVGDLRQLPFAAQSFDLVLAFRLLPHTEDYSAFLKSATALASEEMIFDYAPLVSGNLFATLLFPLKRRIEKNTRHFFTHRLNELRNVLTQAGFSQVHEVRQFSFPMGLHRLLDNIALTERVEDGAKRLGLTRVAGSPSVISARRVKSS